MTDEIDALERRSVEPTRRTSLPTRRPATAVRAVANRAGRRSDVRSTVRAPTPTSATSRRARGQARAVRPPRDSIVARRPVDNEFPNLHDDAVWQRGTRSNEQASDQRAIVSTVARTTTTTTKDADAISKLADAGEDALRRLVDLPRRAVVGVMDRIGDGLHNAAAKLRAVDPLAGRVAALEERFDSLEKSEETESSSGVAAREAADRRETGHRRARRDGAGWSRSRRSRRRWGGNGAPARPSPSRRRRQTGPVATSSTRRSSAVVVGRGLTK